MQTRERRLALVVAALAGLWIGDALVLSPALAWWSGVRQATVAAEREVAEAKVLVERQARIEHDWRARHAAGVLTDEGTARFRLQQTLGRCAKGAGFTIDSVAGGTRQAAPLGPDKRPGYDLLRLSVSGQGSLAEIQGFLAALAAATEPLQIERCELSARDARKDALDVSLTVSTRLSAAPPPGSAVPPRTVPVGTAGWTPEPLDNSVDRAVLSLRPFQNDHGNGRATTVVAQVSATPSAPGGWAVVGLVDTAEGQRAFLRHLGDGSERIVQVGDAAFDGTITALDENAVHIRAADSSTKAVAVGTDVDGTPVPVPTARRTVVAAAPTAAPSPTPAPGGPPAAAPASGPPPLGTTALPGPDADREAILQRLRQNRNRAQ